MVLDFSVIPVSGLTLLKVLKMLEDILGDRFFCSNWILCYGYEVTIECHYIAVFTDSYVTLFLQLYK